MTPTDDNAETPGLSAHGIPFPDHVPVLAVREPVVFPHMIAPITVEDEGTRRMIDEALRRDRLIAIFPLDPKAEASDAQGDEQPAHPFIVDGEEEPSATVPHAVGEVPPLFHVGTLSIVLRMLKIPDGSVRLLVHGISRIAIEEVLSTDPHLEARIRRIEKDEPEPHVEDVVAGALMKQTRDRLQKAIELTSLSEDLAVAALNIEEPGRLADLVASNLSLGNGQVLDVLAELDPMRRLELVHRTLSREVHMLEIGSNISEKVRASVDKSQREFFLREQMKALRDELGDGDPHETELRELRTRLEEKAMPEHARKAATRELNRLNVLQPAAAEYSVIRTYLEWILDLPWEEGTESEIDIKRAAEILDEDHYGLEQVKERILEFLAVLKLKRGNPKGPILCLVGPPGVGKTSLGRSVARATGRAFTRFSLGGMRDEAEIRGHRRTYIGAMPGRIIKALKDTGANNPLIMLDEVDKLGADFRGDPASALLEVLDPEQNDTFVDHYMDMPVDLSRVMFITTANSLDTIPAALRDRMEIIRIAGYTDVEKLEIARRYLVPREIENAGLRKSDVRFNKSGLQEIIAAHTSEAGVRTLQKRIASICRKVARRIAEADTSPTSAKKKGKAPKSKATSKQAAKIKTVSINKGDVEEFLGPPKAHSEVAERLGRPGICIGLAWTPVGGEILFIEATSYPGKGELRLTGHLGDVMKESAQTALSYLRANLKLLGVEDEVFSSRDYHVHVPAGATPKDGPSAGLAMTAALGSLVSGRLARDYVAMTGEISLRGNVLPVGGIKEKVLAAHRAGIREVLLPKRNERDVSEVPDSVRGAVAFRFVDRIEDALAHTLKR